MQIRYDRLLAGAQRATGTAVIIDVFLAFGTVRRFFRADQPDFPVEDPVLCLQRDVYEIALRAERDRDRVVVPKIEM